MIPRAALAAALLAVPIAVPVLLPAQSTTPRLQLRFHHLHYIVADPGAALRPVAEALQGTRTIVPGVGVGVRVDREYLLFTRLTDETSSRRRATPVESYINAARWLASRGLQVAPVALNATSISRSLPDERLDHVAFATDDLAAAVAAIRAKPISSNDVAATFRLPSGSIVEIVRDTDRPDAYWCPMHPDVRSPGTGKCPQCGMALVEIPPLRPGEFRLDARLIARPDGGASRVQLAVHDPDGGDVVTRFIDVHERPFHLFIIGRDLEYFAHVHPTLASDGTFDLHQDLSPGAYLLVADFLPTGGTSQLVQRMVTTPGYSGPLFVAPPPLPSLPNQHVASGLRIRMDARSPGPRRAADIRFELAEASTGQPVTDLEPYLGAPGHLLIADNELTTAIHGHPEGATTTGPVVTFSPVLPRSGRYKVWVQFQRKGEVITAPFVIDVPPELK